MEVLQTLVARVLKALPNIMWSRFQANASTAEAPPRQVAHVQKVRISFMRLMLALKSAFIATARQVLEGLVAKARVEGMCWVGRLSGKF